MANVATVVSPRETLPMSVANMTFMLDRLGKDCSPLQFIRELTQNSIESILNSSDQTGQVIWDVDWNRHSLTGIHKLALIDTGIGMTGPEMVEYINKLSSSIHTQSTEGNFGVGAKIAAAPKNHAGMVYLSWKDGVGYMIHLWRDPDTNVYGLRRFERPDGSSEYWAEVEDTIKPPEITENGTMVILLGNSEEQNTLQPPEGTPMPSRWILRYLNSRYLDFPSGISVKAREGWELPRNDSHNFLRTITGMRPWLDSLAEAKGQVTLTDATAHWWILKEDADKDAGHYAPIGHVAAAYKNELYEMSSGRAGVTRLQLFGVIFGYSHVVIYVEPHNGKTNEITPNTARTHLLLNGESLPWTEWAQEFRENMPSEIVLLMEKVGSAMTGGDYKQTIKERIRQIMDMFRFSRYRPSSKGTVELDEDSLTTGGSPKPSGGSRSSGSRSGGGHGGRAGDVYALFLASKGIPGEAVRNVTQPEVKWVSVADGSRVAPDLEDRAAKYLSQQNLILANGDFRGFTDMIDRWEKQYPDLPGAHTVIQQVVREWFEQQLIEAVLGALALRTSNQWTMEELTKMWSEESLTAVVMPRYHVDVAVKRSLGQKLGSLKQKVS